MAFHFGYYSVAHLLAIACFHNFWVAMVLCFSIVLVALWNGASYYMDFFAKKY